MTADVMKNAQLAPVVADQKQRQFHELERAHVTWLWHVRGKTDASPHRLEYLLSLDDKIRAIVVIAVGQSAARPLGHGVRMTLPITLRPEISSKASRNRSSV